MKRNLIGYPALLLGLCLLVASAASAEIVDSQRTELQDGIVHYTFDLDLGPEEFDTVRLHRVVREKRPYKPVATADGIFLLPGAPNFWVQIFVEPLISTAIPWDQSVAIFLAKNDIDVWGMDYAWALVPLGHTDFDFMEGWGLQRDIDDARKAIATARSIRVATGQGNRRLHLLGFSYGVPLAYAIAGEETQLPPGKRHVKGIIPVDYDLKVDDEIERLDSCWWAEYAQSEIDAGNYQNEDGVGFWLIGTLAQSDPDGFSPIPGLEFLTNWQVALFVGMIHDPWHFVGGVFDPFPFPAALLFTDEDLWVDLAASGAYYLPWQAFLDLDATRCDEVDMPFDDHLGDIALPILTIGAAGGAAPDPYTPSLTASEDVQHLPVQLLADDEFMFDFGHADLFTADDADELVWEPLLDWLLDHRENRTYP